MIIIIFSYVFQSWVPKLGLHQPALENWEVLRDRAEMADSRSSMMRRTSQIFTPQIPAVPSTNWWHPNPLVLHIHSGNTKISQNLATKATNQNQSHTGFTTLALIRAWPRMSWLPRKRGTDRRPWQLWAPMFTKMPYLNEVIIGEESQG